MAAAGPVLDAELASEALDTWFMFDTDKKTLASVNLRNTR